GRRGGWSVGCGLWFLRLFILPHTLAGIFILASAVGSTLIWLAVALFGTQIEGEVVNTTATQSRKSRSVTYSLVYHYTIAGEKYRNSVSISAEDYAALKKGQSLPI